MSADSPRRRFLASVAAATGTFIAGCTADSAPTESDAARSDVAGTEPESDETPTVHEDPCEDVTVTPEPDETETETTADENPERIDDWQYTPPPKRTAQPSSGSVTATAQATGTPGGSIGLSAGGAKDIATFRRNVEEGYLPIPESLSYEGLFYNYYFNTGDDLNCGSTFYPTYSPAVTRDPLSDETERYLTVGLNSGLDASEFDRKQLNLVVVLDISGSMSSSFSEYYYDRFGNRQTPEGETDRPKIEVAEEALIGLTEQLRPGDRLGIVLYNDESAVAKPLRPVEATDMDAIRGHIREDVRAGGGTKLSGGIDDATSMLAEYDDADPEIYENRMIVLTDAMPNFGETSAGGLQATLERFADDRIHSTFVGVGVDFHAELVDELTAIRGANYYGVHSADEFTERLGEEFKYMVTPLVFDLDLELDADGYDIEKVYGSTAAEEATGEIASLNTLFASPSEGGGTRGGVVLVQVSRESDDASMALTTTWTDRDGTAHEISRTVEFPDVDPDHYANTGVQKAVLLSRYADLLKNWMVAERQDELPMPDDGIAVPPPSEELGKWEQQSEPLTVSDVYRTRIRAFREHYLGEMDAIGDESLDQEAEMLSSILDAAD